MQVLVGYCVVVPETTHRFGDLLGGSQQIHCSKRTQSEGSEGKRGLGRGPEEIRLELPKALKHQIVPGVECCPQRSLLRLWAQGFYWGPVTKTPSAQHRAESQTPRGTADTVRKPECLYQQVRCRELLLPVLS